MTSSDRPSFKSKFTFHQRNVTFDEAKSSCEDDGGHLAYLKTKKKVDKIVGILRANNINTDASWWIGMKYNNELKEYAWLDGEKYQPLDKHPVAPMQSGFCGYPEIHAQKNETKCRTNSNYYICENEIPKTPVEVRPVVTRSTAITRDGTSVTSRVTTNDLYSSDTQQPTITHTEVTRHPTISTRATLLRIPPSSESTPRQSANITPFVVSVPAVALIFILLIFLVLFFVRRHKKLARLTSPEGQSVHMTNCKLVDINTSDSEQELINISLNDNGNEDQNLYTDTIRTEKYHDRFRSKRI